MENPTDSWLGDDGTAHVAVHGEIDFTNADDVAQAFRDAVTGWSPAELRVDLRAATFIDSTGLGALIEGYRAAAAQDSRFVVTNPSAAFWQVLTVTGLCELFGMTEADQPAREQESSFSSATSA